MANNNGFTPVQSAILKVLSDGMAHRKQELHGCLMDELGSLTTVRVHLCHIRKKLRPIGEDIICELKNRNIWYRHVRLLASAYDGKR